MAVSQALRAMLAACAALMVCAPAAWAAPQNDNYLASTQMQDASGVMRTFSDTQDTRTATVQPDLWNPSADGAPLGGGGAEPTSCDGSPHYANTVWYDFLPEISGGVEIQASGYDTVVAVYEYDPANPRLGRLVACENAGVAEHLIIPEVEGGRAYTVQVGAVGGVAGDLSFSFFFFGDRDEDGILDEQPDRCLDVAGIGAAGGCPPKLRASLSLEWQNTATGVRFTSVRVRGAPRGARILAKCRRCGVRKTRERGRRRSRPVKLKRLIGREAPTGAVLKVYVTMEPRGRRRYRHGAIGSYLRYVFEAGGIRKRTIRCLPPDSMKPRKRCT